jgi:hypothetical protein
MAFELKQKMLHVSDLKYILNKSRPKLETEIISIKEDGEILKRNYA